MESLFIGGDPRFLSGGAATSYGMSYDTNLKRIDESDGVVDSEITVPTTGPDRIARAVEMSGQTVHSGRRHYHDRPQMNAFARKNDEVTVGVELELETKDTESVPEMMKAMKSNWFHFECDSSLSKPGHEGWELVTEPIPQRIASRPELWVGLENVLSPWFESFGHSETGLHVHMSTHQFRNMKMPFPCEHGTTGKLARHAIMYLYYLVMDRSLVDRVMLRSNTHYCSATSGVEHLMRLHRLVETTKVDATWFWVELLAGTWIDNKYDLQSLWSTSSRTMDSCTASKKSLPIGHGTEVNFEHTRTIECRRGKGTVNGISIHRMVELWTRIGNYVTHLSENPGAVVGRSQLYEYIAETTTSDALRNIIKTHSKRKEG